MSGRTIVFCATGILHTVGGIASANRNVKIALEQVVLTGKQRCQTVKGDITWPKAGATAFEQTVDLGDFKANLDCDRGALVVKVVPKNDLGLSFNATLSPRGIAGSGYLKPPATFPAELKSLLPFLGQKDKNGRYKLKL